MARRFLLASSVAILAWPLAGYPALLWVIARLRGRPAAPDAGDRPPPTMTVVVPTYREQANITARLENLAACEYPRERLEVLVVDSASGDGTAEEAEAFAAGCPGLRVRVLREAERGGKAAAINVALAACATDLVVITDAPTCFVADALSVIAEEFRDPGVGAATGYFEVTGDEGMVQREEASFWRMRNLLRTLEADVDSTPFLSGELCCFRRTLVERLDVDSLADDMNIAMQVRRAGYRVVVNNRARFSEPRSNRAAELVETKTRRAAGGVQELLRARDMVGNRRYGWFGMLILPSAATYYLPLRVPAAAIVGVGALRALAGLRRRRPGTAAAAAIAGVTLVLAGAPRIAPRVAMLVFNEMLLVRAWWRICFRQMDVRWVQERSTRGIGDEAEAAEGVLRG